MTGPPFVGRHQELSTLESLLNIKAAKLVVIKGRRRIGKSRLVEEFAKGRRYYQFTGLFPTEDTTPHSQREEFLRQMAEQLNLPPINIKDWGDIFSFFSQYTSQGLVIILFDEISWMGSKDPLFLSKLKIAWDLYFSKNPNLILILCGSISAWIEKNILNSTGYFGRISTILSLEELPLKSCNELLDDIGFKWSTLEKYIVLSLTGGVPWYITLINGHFNAETNIHKLCFEKEARLVLEFKFIFHDLFGKRSEIYKKIVQLLAKTPSEYQEIADHLNYPSGGPLSEYLDELISARFISRDFTWSFKTQKKGRLSRFRLRDNYLHFYLKHIEPNLDKINRDRFEDVPLSSLPGWDAILGLQFEKLVLNNRNLILKKLGIPLQDIVYDNPFFQRKTSLQKGCQIDYLIQTRFKNLIACEIKFTSKIIKGAVIQEMKQKLERLKIPRGFSCTPVLIYAGELQESVQEANYFLECINFEDILLEKSC